MACSSVGIGPDADPAVGWVGGSVSFCLLSDVINGMSSAVMGASTTRLQDIFSTWVPMRSVKVVAFAVMIWRGPSGMGWSLSFSLALLVYYRLTKMKLPGVSVTLLRRIRFSASRL